MAGFCIASFLELQSGNNILLPLVKYGFLENYAINIEMMKSLKDKSGIDIIVEHSRDTLL